MLNKTRLLTPGPTAMPEGVRLALARDMIHHRKSAFQELMLEVQKSLKILFGTDGTVIPLASSGSGAMTAAAGNLFAPGEKVIVARVGKFGERWLEIAQSRGLDVLDMPSPPGQPVDLAALERALDQDRAIRGVFIQVSETSTGVLNPVRQIARLAGEKNALLVADGISAVGISPCPMDDWGIDCLLTGSQKGLMLPPGLALIALSERAWKKNASVAPGCYYFDLARERKAVENGQTRFTTPVSMIFGLAESMKLLLKDGLEAIFRKQWALTMQTRHGIKAMGLEPLAAADFTWGLTSVLMPQGIDAGKVLKIAESRYGVCMAGAPDELKSRVVRLGHMGHVDWADVLAGLYALRRALLDSGAELGGRDFLECSMDAYNAALELGPGVEIPARTPGGK